MVKLTGPAKGRANHSRADIHAIGIFDRERTAVGSRLDQVCRIDASFGGCARRDRADRAVSGITGNSSARCGADGNLAQHMTCFEVLAGQDGRRFTRQAAIGFRHDKFARVLFFGKFSHDYFPFLLRAA
jgi:hypothetical protein